MGSEIGFLHAFLLACGLLAAGLAVRARLRVLRATHVPASVVAGLLGFALVQAGTRLPATAGATRAVVDEMKAWPAVLIAVVFAGLLLERSAPSAGATFGAALRRGARSASLAWIIILGQIVIGLLVYAVMVRPAAPGVPASFGQLLEVSWAGGHGASAAMGEVYAGLGFPEGRDLAFFLATVGLVYGVVSGLVLVNVAIRRGWTRRARDVGSPHDGATADTGVAAPSSPTGAAPPINRGFEPLAVQVVVLAAAFAAGWGMQLAFAAGAGLLLGADDPDVKGQAVDFAQNVPLFLFTLLGGLLVRHAMRWVRADAVIDGTALRRLVGVAMEFLIVAAVATIRIEALRAFWLPVALLVLLAAAWTAFCLLVLARRLLPPAYWFELGLLNYGFSTANTPQGMMLLRIVDPDLKSGAAEDYAVAAPLSAPFVGGGVVTIVALPLLLQRVPPVVAAAAISMLICVLYAGGRALAQGQAQPATGSGAS